MRHSACEWDLVFLIASDKLHISINSCCLTPYVSLAQDDCFWLIYSRMSLNILQCIPLGIQFGQDVKVESRREYRMRSTSKFFTWLECGWDQWCNYACNILNSPFLNFSARFQTVLMLICCFFSTCSSWKHCGTAYGQNVTLFSLSKDEMKKKKKNWWSWRTPVGQRYICSVYNK